MKIEPTEHLIYRQALLLCAMISWYICILAIVSEFVLKILSYEENTWLNKICTESFFIFSLYAYTFIVAVKNNACNLNACQYQEHSSSNYSSTESAFVRQKIRISVFEWSIFQVSTSSVLTDCLIYLVLVNKLCQTKYL